jgi:hypothetical protein
MEDVMKNLRYFVLAIVAVLFASTAHAQQNAVQASIPFPFVVDGQSYPAGDYTILTDHAPSHYVILRATGEVKMTVMLRPQDCISQKNIEQSKMIFHHVGDTYFLYQVWRSGDLNGKEFNVSKQEIRLAAKNTGKSEVIVAANAVR